MAFSGWVLFLVVGLLGGVCVEGLSVFLLIAVESSFLALTLCSFVVSWVSNSYYLKLPDIAKGLIDIAKFIIDIAKSLIDIAKCLIDIAKSLIDIAKSLSRHF